MAEKLQAPGVSASIISKGNPLTLHQDNQHGRLSTLTHHAYGSQVSAVLSLTGTQAHEQVSETFRVAFPEIHGQDMVEGKLKSKPNGPQT